MKLEKLFPRNIGRAGRLVRGISGLALLGAGIFLFFTVAWAGVLLVAAGGFTLFEAVRGWCVLRACGVKTKW